jgi:hypothetical protein
LAANARAGLKVVFKLFPSLALDTVGDAYCSRSASNRPSAATVISTPAAHAR